MSPLITAGIHHITLVARDARRTLAFYRDVLGLGLVKKTVNFDDPGAYHLYFGDATGAPGTIVTSFEWPTAPRGHYGVGGVHHLALGTATRETQLMWKRRLEDHGVAVTGPLPRGYFTSIYFSDPDGQILEIATAGPGYATDEVIDALGAKEVAPQEEELPGHRDAVAIAATWPEPVPVVTPAMRLDGIHHISGLTDDLERAGDFYESALGLRIVKKTWNKDDPRTKHWFWANYDGARVAKHSAITLFGWTARHRRAQGGVGQTHHIAFRARDAAEQLAWREHLLGLGLRVSPVMERSYFQSIYFSAPDGQLLEIATDGPGFAVDESPATLGSALRLPPWLEAERAAITAALTPLD
ncbi:MAG: VOC family protein [Gemmatimonadaceae bacterium]|nr:VOC family protein [Gemmatimonadaceae bacterium]